MDANLGTTNVLLAVMAVVMVFEALVIIGVAIAGWVVYRRVGSLIDRLEERRIEPLLAQVTAILADLRGVTATMKEEAQRVDTAIRYTMDRVDDTADRVRSNVRVRTSWLVGFIRGVKTALDEIAGGRQQPPAGAAGRV
jgi:predicted PurR-regulated permease PerM